MERYKVHNDRRYDIGLTLINGLERVVKAGSYTLLTQEEIEHLASIAPSVFMDERRLRLEDRAMAVKLGFVQDVNLPVFGPDEIRKQLSANANKMKKWLDGIEDEPKLAEVFEIAKTMDLPASKLQILQERMPGKDMIEAKEA